MKSLRYYDMLMSIPHQWTGGRFCWRLLVTFIGPRLSRWWHTRCLLGLGDFARYGTEDVAVRRFLDRIDPSHGMGQDRKAKLDKKAEHGNEWYVGTLRNEWPSAIEVPDGDDARLEVYFDRLYPMEDFLGWLRAKIPSNLQIQRIDITPWDDSHGVMSFCRKGTYDHQDMPVERMQVGFTGHARPRPVLPVVLKRTVIQAGFFLAFYLFVRYYVGTQLGLNLLEAAALSSLFALLPCVVEVLIQDPSQEPLSLDDPLSTDGHPHSRPWRIAGIRFCAGLLDASGKWLPNGDLVLDEAHQWPVCLSDQCSHRAN